MTPALSTLASALPRANRMGCVFLSVVAILTAATTSTAAAGIDQNVQVAPTTSPASPPFAPAQTSAPKPSPKVPAKKNSASGSGWSALNAAQRQALRPLAPSWDSLSAGQRRKWLEISREYPSLSAADQTKMHSRMSEWVALSARERANARLNFAATSELSKELSPQEKKAKWDAYQSLSAEEKKKLAETGARRPPGAATATRPVATDKLATLPITAPVRLPKMVLDQVSDTALTTDPASGVSN